MSHSVRIYMMVDFEGGACIVGKPGSTLTDSGEQFALSQRVMTREANAAAEGAFAAGATEVVVNDAHGSGLNLLYEELHPDVRVMLGSPRPTRFPGMDEGFAGLCLIGYHGMSGTADSVLAHSYSSKAVHRVWVNGLECGEVAMDAAYAGTRFGVPTIFVSGDDKVCAEAQAVLGGIETAETKIGYGRNAAISLTPRKSCDIIRAAVERAVRRADSIEPLVWNGPLEVKRVFKHEHLAEEAAKRPHAQRIDGFTVIQRHDSVTEMLG